MNYEGPYAEGLLRALDVQVETDETELKNIPSEGAAIVIANHPTGALDGIVLIDLISRLRPDVRFIGNFLLNRIAPLKQFFIDVDPFDASSTSNVSGVRESLRHLEQGGLLVIFPAGEVATWQHGLRDIGDRPWPNSSLRFIRHAKCPIVPIHIEARNSLLFRAVGLIHPLLRTLLLPRELVNKRGARVTVRIASPVLPKRTEELSVQGYGSFLRAEVDYLRPWHKRRLSIVVRRPAIREADAIGDAVPVEVLCAELETLRSECRLFVSGDYEVFLSAPERIPQMMQMIGMMRERTFREIGEGTNRAIDTDRYDSYYRQLFIWDREAQRLVGAYRLGMGDQIMQRYGLRGFYTDSLFRMSAPMGEVMARTIELGRSFIVRDYQRKPASLMLLWKGILHVLLKNEQYRYLMGPVTISGGFQATSKRLITEYIRRYYLDREKCCYVHPRTGLRLSVRINDALLDDIPQIDLINKLVCDIERNAFAMPVLIRKYLQLNSSVLGFNTDAQFNDSIDALMLLDLQRVPEETILMLSKELSDIDVVSRFKQIQV